MGDVNDLIEVSFEGFWLCRLATDPDPSLEDRGISGFTFAVAGEDLLDPSLFCQAEDVEAAYGRKDPAFTLGAGDTDPGGQGGIRNIRAASPDYARYNRDGIGIRVTEVRVRGDLSPVLTERLKGMQVRFTSEGVPGHRFRGPIFEGRNQIVSDGDPDRFTVNPLVFQIRTDDRTDPDRVLLQRFDPLVPEEWDTPLYRITDPGRYLQRFPCQRFPTSQKLLDSLGIPDPVQHFVNRRLWLKEKVAEAEALGRPGLTEAYTSRLFGVEFFTEATGPTVLENRLASRIPLRQLYIHDLRGTDAMQPGIVVRDDVFDPGDLGGAVRIATDRPWPIEYYLGAYDGDLMAGFATGTVTLPFTVA